MTVLEFQHITRLTTTMTNNALTRRLLRSPEPDRLNAVMDDDRRFFADHPERTLRVRDPYPIEHAEFDLSPDAVDEIKGRPLATA
jgi:hypothetical protein